MKATHVTTVVALSLLSAGSATYTSKAETPSLAIPKSEQLLWAEYSPYFALGRYEPPPLNCKIDQVNILQRHGARFPTSAAAAGIVAALNKIQSAKAFKHPNLEFLRNFTYDLGKNDLVPFGAAQSRDAGAEAFTRYSRLFNMNDLPFVRSDSSQRVVDSARNWTAGVAAASKNRVLPKLDVILNSNGNDTLENSCPAAPTSEVEDEAWINAFAPPITKFLNAAAPGANLTNLDVFSLITLCPFETVAKETKSDFCTLFEGIPGAFDGIEYTGDLDKYYGTGYGNPLGRVQGVGYVNELLARLTGTPVHDETTTNRTLDDDPATFPLNRTVYADFSHDDQIAAIIAALGLFKQAENLDPTRPNPRRTWRASTLVPFSGRMVVERLRCKRDETMVRIFVQDILMNLDFCGANLDGLCTLENFVRSQAYARSGGMGDFQRCFATGTTMDAS